MAHLTSNDGLVVALLVGLSVSIWHWSRRSPRSFPGPVQLPFFGNALIMPKGYEWLTYSSWSKIYGPVFQIKVFGQNSLILNSPEIADELLNKRAKIYSDRPPRSRRQRTVFNAPYDDVHRNDRRLLHNALNIRAAQTYWPLLEEEAHSMLQRLLSTPDNFSQHVRRMSGSTVLNVTYGCRIDSDDHPFLVLAQEAMGLMVRVTSAGTHWSNTLPFNIDLTRYPDWVPGAAFQRLATAFAQTLSKFTTLPFEYVKKNMAAGTALPSYVSTLLENNDAGSDGELSVRRTAGALYAGGADTGVSTTLSFILGMALNQAAQKRAQDEIDHVVGQERLPGFSDRDSLPYIECIVKEVLRWNPVTPLAVGHAATEDDVFEGIPIAAGTSIIPNVWHFLHDPEIYSNPTRFNPDRFLPRDIQHPDLVPTDPRRYAFGFGRRQCPGIHVADATMYISIVSILAAFDISKALDEQGNVIEPQVEYTTGLLSFPKPFKCSITPRSKMVADLIMHTSDSHE